MTASAALQPAHVLDRDALRAARSRAGMSLRTVAGHIDRHWVTVGRYETGPHDVPSSVLGVLAGLYGVEVGAFYRRDPQNTPRTR